jgi:hypothetical protein
LFGIVHALYKSRTTKGAKKMQTILNFFRKQETTTFSENKKQQKKFILTQKQLQKAEYTQNVKMV